MRRQSAGRTHHRRGGGRPGKDKKKKWGPLLGGNAWGAGTFWDSMKGTVDVFLGKNGERNEVDVEKEPRTGKSGSGSTTRAPSRNKSKARKRKTAGQSRKKSPWLRTDKRRRRLSG